MSTEIDWTPKARAVLAAADELFYTHGIHAVGVDAIAAQAGVTKKTLYDRFGSKERLVVEYLRQRDLEWREFLEQQLNAAQDDPQSMVHAVFTASASWSKKRSGKGCSMINAHAELSDQNHPGYSVIMAQKKWMLALFTDIAAKAGVSDVSGTAQSIMLIHEGALVAAGMKVFTDVYSHASKLAVNLLGST